MQINLSSPHIFLVCFSVLSSIFLSVLGWLVSRLVKSFDNQVVELKGYDLKLEERINKHEEKFECETAAFSDSFSELKQVVTSNQFHHDLAIQRLTLIMEQLSGSIDYLSRRLSGG